MGMFPSRTRVSRRRVFTLACIALFIPAFAYTTHASAAGKSTAPGQVKKNPTTTTSTAMAETTKQQSSILVPPTTTSPAATYLPNIQAPATNGSENGVAAGKPCAGCVGKADNKAPKGQTPDGSDHNHGHICDMNNGIGKGDPAHSGCTAAIPAQTETTRPSASTSTSTPSSTTTTAAPTTTTTKARDVTANATTQQPQAQLAHTGTDNSDAIEVAVALVMSGLMFAAAAGGVRRFRLPVGAHFRAN